MLNLGLSHHMLASGLVSPLHCALLPEISVTDSLTQLKVCQY